MPHHRFGRTDWHSTAESRTRSPFSCIVENSCRPVRVHIVDGTRCQPGRLQGSLHCKFRTDAGRMRLGQMIGIGGDSVADDFRERHCAAMYRVLFRLQDQKGSALAQDQTTSILVERPNFLRRRSLERIEAYEYQFAQWIVASAYNASAQPVSDKFKSVPDRIGPGRAGVGNNLGRNPQTVSLKCVEY